jgi:deoxyribodipyrimidine photo-lyase
MLERLRAETGFRLLVAHEETGTAVTYARDRRVRRWARSAGVEFVELPQTGVVRRLGSRDGWNAIWERRMESPQASLARATGRGGLEAIERLEHQGILDCRDLGQPADTKDRQLGGERAAHDLLEDFLHERGHRYAGGISSPVSAATSCSRLSPHLAFGTLSLRQVWQASETRRRAVAAAADASPHDRQRLRAWQRSLRAVQSRLHWHCHFMQKLESEPSIEATELHPAARGLRLCPGDPALLAAWAKGETGFPFFDACMRSLSATGWINFRMRAMLVSFASYNLWLPWQETGPVLARLFTDYEPGIHWPQMQMQSGTTGINTIRLYNPVKQGHDQDPDGAFVRRWVPELESVPDEHLQEPWMWPDAATEISQRYPVRIVDLAATTKAAKDRIYGARRSAGFRAAASAIQDKHGSRKSGMPITGQKRSIKSSSAPAKTQLEFDL